VTQPLQPWRTGPAGITVFVRVSPKSARQGVEGLAETAQGLALNLRVRAAADRGEANRAAERVMADWLGVAKSRIAVAAGAKSRLKLLSIGGEPDRLAALMKKHVAALR
jgi:uncharacterized protein